MIGKAYSRAMNALYAFLFFDIALAIIYASFVAVGAFLDSL
jgi:hypothetical protein